MTDRRAVIDSPWPTVAPTGCAIGLSAPSGRIMKNISPGRRLSVSSSGALAGFSSGAITLSATPAGRRSMRAAGASGLSFDWNGPSGSASSKST